MKTLLKVVGKIVKVYLIFDALFIMLIGVARMLHHLTAWIKGECTLSEGIDRAVNEAAETIVDDYETIKDL